MCMKKPVVCTAVAAEGIALTHGETALLADDETFANATVSCYKIRRYARDWAKGPSAVLMLRLAGDLEQLEEAFQEAVRKRK